MKNILTIMFLIALIQGGALADLGSHGDFSEVEELLRTRTLYEESSDNQFEQLGECYMKENAVHSLTATKNTAFILP